MKLQEVDLSNLPQNTILVAKELATSDTARLNLKNVAGIITEIGGVNSHMAIMARTHEIPAIVGIKHIFENIKENDFIALNVVLDTACSILQASRVAISLGTPSL